MERASPALLRAIQRRRRVVVVEPGSYEERYLDLQGAEANAGGEDNCHILVRPNPSKAALLEEFLHGTQNKLGMLTGASSDNAERAAAECHVKDFMIRHRRLLGLGDEDVRRLTLLRDAGL